MMNINFDFSLNLNNFFWLFSYYWHESIILTNKTEEAIFSHHYFMKMWNTKCWKKCMVSTCIPSTHYLNSIINILFYLLYHICSSTHAIERLSLIPFIFFHSKAIFKHTEQSQQENKQLYLINNSNIPFTMHTARLTVSPSMLASNPTLYV